METLSITNCPTSDCNSKKIFKIKWKPSNPQGVDKPTRDIG